MKRIETALPGVWIIEPRVFGDDRGFFLESYHAAKFADLGIVRNWVQDNHSGSMRGVLRGLHYQIVAEQAKLVRVVSGSVFDVAVDIRRGSPHFGQWIGVELSAQNKRMLFVPEGFAHGFLTLEDGTQFVYKCSALYAPEHERAVIWNDPQVGITWPDVGAAPVLSGKDGIAPRLADQPDLPVYTAL